MVNLDDDYVVCRPALQKDTDAVMELSSHIWEGHDYIPHVWEEWLADPDGLLGVAEVCGRIAGVFKLAKFQEEEWYLEGLRVHPDFRDRGVASHIHNYVVDTWRRMGSGIIRLVTASFNVKVHRMCENGGFRRINEFIPNGAKSLGDRTPDFTEVTIDEAEEALEYIIHSPSHALSSGLINLEWVFADPQLKHIRGVIGEGQAWWWKGRKGFISIWVDDEDGEYYPGIQLIGCSLDDLQELLIDYRRLMAVKGYKTAGWVVPNRPEAITSATNAGFERNWENSMYIYELREGVY